MNSQLVDERNQSIMIGSIVTVVGTNFDGFDGVVMDVASNIEPEDGPIAVFFDFEVPSWHFTNEPDYHKWKGERPTPENYQECPRIVCFEVSDLVVISEFSDETLVSRVFGGSMKPHTIRTLKFRLEPNTHLCQFKDCQSGLMATERVVVNVWGTACVVYACSPCHKEKNGMCTEIFELKTPLPGSFAA